MSKSNVYRFKHNDVADLERILKETMPKSKKELVKKFVVIEGLYYNYGGIFISNKTAPLLTNGALKLPYCEGGLI